ncbi:hypothetical protein [Nonomuraea sp. NPDC046570]|uniref:hypothetical protein n=1 Tax=Nonomuraea sp. NPDC046570 TaxID=3155255 RepID=UPI0033E68A88
MTTVLLPDLGDDLVHVLNELEKLLLTYAIWESEGDVEVGELPAPLEGRVALEALQRVSSMIAVTQGRRAPVVGRGGRLLAADGRYELVPLRLVDVAQADVDTLAAAARVLGDPDAGDVVREGLEEGRADMSGAGLVLRAAQLAALLGLAATDDSKLLCGRLAAAGPADDVVLTAGQQDAYQRTVTRLNAMWALGDPAERYHYGDRGAAAHGRERTEPDMSALPAGTHLAYRRRVPNMVHVMATRPDGSHAWQFTIADESDGSFGESLAVKVTWEAYAAFTQIPDFFAALASRRPMFLDEVEMILKTLGAVKEIPKGGRAR